MTLSSTKIKRNEIQIGTTPPRHDPYSVTGQVFKTVNSTQSLRLMQNSVDQVKEMSPGPKILKIKLPAKQ